MNEELSARSAPTEPDQTQITAQPAGTAAEMHSESAAGDRNLEPQIASAPNSGKTAGESSRTWEPEALKRAAHAAAQSWNAMHRPSGRSGFAERTAAAGTALDKLMARVEATPGTPGDASDPLLDLRENGRLLRSAVVEAKGSRRPFERLPRLAAEGDQQLLRIAAVAASYFDATSLAWDAEALGLFLLEAQKSEPLNLDELWSLPTLMKFHLLETVLADAQGLPETRPRIQRAIKSLRDLGYADWTIIAEPLITFDLIFIM